VLLCEDNYLNTEIAAHLLREEGMQVVCAENGAAGAELFAASAPGYFDAVLMDLRMPVLDGYGATAKIRGMDRPDAASVPIIAMTADAFADDIARCRAAGMNAHVAKPIRPEELLAALGGLCGRPAAPEHPEP
jgi:CheY-like chemotaxis protein